MLKFFFWSFLILNAGLAAFNLGYLGIEESRGASRSHPQKNAVKLIVVSAEPEPAASASKASTVPAAATPTVVEPLACLEVGNFAAAEAPGVEATLQQLSFGQRQSRVNVSEKLTYMVYIPPLGSKEAADRKAGELERRGIKDFFVIQEADLRWGISLGIFKTEEAARQHLNDLILKGLHSGRTRARPVPQRFAYQLHAVTPDEKAKFDTLEAKLPAHGTRDCT